MITSWRAATASSYMISGAGLAMAKTIGFGAMLRTMSGVTVPPAERPMKTSAPFIASVSERASVSAANSSLYGVMATVRPL